MCVNVIITAERLTIGAPPEAAHGQKKDGHLDMSAGELTMKLYRWQRECLDRWERNDYTGIVNVVTGAGKTVFALEAIDRLRMRYPGLRVRIVVPTIPLARQWETALRRHAPSEGYRPGFFGGGARDDPDRDVMLYIINSARDALSGHFRRELALRRHVLLICDECHHCQSPQNRRIFDFLTPEVKNSGLYHCLGLSATPFGTDGDDLLRRTLGPEIFRYGFDDAGRDSVISPFALCEVSAPFLPEELEAYSALTSELGVLAARLRRNEPRLKKLEGADFLKEIRAMANRAGMDPGDPAAAFLLKAIQRREVSNLAETRVRCALAILERLSPSDRVLLFCERIEQARQAAEAIRRRWGNICGVYHSGLTEEAKARNLRDFREGRTRILVSCRCLDEGIDVPDANIGIVMSCAAAQRQRIQRLGRLIRVSPDKDAACLYYIYIRESNDDAAYLPGLENCEVFSLRYYSAEDSFSNDLYEYAAGALLVRAKETDFGDNMLGELRRCLIEGLPRADCLLPASVLEERRRRARSTHERNYWRAMAAVGKLFRTEIRQPRLRSGFGEGKQKV